MQITQVETLSELPKYVTQAYTINNRYTVDDAMRHYEILHRVKPETATQFGIYLFVDLPRKDEGK